MFGATRITASHSDCILHSLMFSETSVLILEASFKNSSNALSMKPRSLVPDSLEQAQEFAAPDGEQLQPHGVSVYDHESSAETM